MKSLLYAAGAALGITLAPAAHALPFINGSVVVSDSVTNVPGAPTTSIVSGLNIFDSGPVLVGSSTGDLSSATSPANANPLHLSPPSGSYTITVGADVFTFTVDSLDSQSSIPLACKSGLCGDSLQAVVDGQVTDSLGLFASTGFLGDFAATGVCVGAAGTCVSNVVGAWNITLVATGTPTPPPVPEPASLMVLGTGLIGLGAVATRRRRRD